MWYVMEKLSQHAVFASAADLNGFSIFPPADAGGQGLLLVVGAMISSSLAT